MYVCVCACVRACVCVMLCVQFVYSSTHSLFQRFQLSDYVDLKIADFMLKDDTNSAEDNDVMFGARKFFTLQVDLLQSGSEQLQESGRDYEPRFGLSAEASVDPVEYLNDPFGSGTPQDTALNQVRQK